MNNYEHLVLPLPKNSPHSRSLTYHNSKMLHGSQLLLLLLLLLLFFVVVVFFLNL